MGKGGRLLQSTRFSWPRVKTTLHAQAEADWAATHKVLIQPAISHKRLPWVTKFCLELARLLVQPPLVLTAAHSICFRRASEAKKVNA